MTTPRSVVNFESGETLTPSKLNIGFERIHKDLINTSDKKFVHASALYDFSGLTDTHRQIDRQVSIILHGTFEITGVELVLYQAVGNVTSVSLTMPVNNGGWKSPTVVPAGVTTRSRDTKDITEYVNSAFNTELVVTASGTPWTLTRCYAIVHYKYEVPGASDFTEQTSPRFASGETLAAAKLNTAFTDYETELAAITTQLPRFSVIHFWRDLAVSPASSDIDIRVPDSIRTFSFLEVYHTGDTGNNVTITLYDDTPSVIATATANGVTGTRVSTSQAVSVTQDENSPYEPTDDWKLTLSRTGGAIIPLVYMVLREV